MKILAISCERGGWSGGAEQFTLLVKGLREKGHNLHTVCVSGSPLEERMRNEGFNVLALPMWNDVDLYSALRIAHYCLQNNIEIIHAMHSRGHSVALLAEYLMRRIPLVVTRRVSFFIQDNLYTRFKYRNKRIDKFICVSEAVKKELINFKISDEKINVIYSGVDTEKFRPKDKDSKLLEKLGIPLSKPIVGGIANFSKWKGQKIFIESAKIVKERKLNVHFLLAGAGNDGEPVRGWVEANGLKDMFTLHGFVDHVPSFMSLIDVFVSPSVGAEGLSGTLREALAMGLPVIATDVGGNKEIVKHMESGVIVPPSVPEAIADGIEFMLKNREKARSMAETGRKFVIENLSVKKMVERTERIYLELV
jgi:glycosyltransferase involved in cell wall biosynthesis